MDLNHPLLQSVVIPVLLAVVLAGGIRWGLGTGTGQRHCDSAVGIALLAAMLLVLGEPVWPPRTGLHKLPFILLASLIAGAALDAMGSPRRATLATGAVAIALVSPWLAWPQLAGADPGKLWPVIPAAILGLGALAALAGAPAAGAHRPAMLVVCALALAGASLNAGSLVLFQLALALAAAVGGYALWTWPKPRLPFTAAAVLAAGVGCYALTLSTLLLTGIRAWALLPLVLVFAGSRIALRLPVPAAFSHPMVEPLYIVAAGLVPAIAAILLAHPPSAADDPYYN